MFNITVNLSSLKNAKTIEKYTGIFQLTSLTGSVKKAAWIPDPDFWPDPDLTNMDSKHSLGLFVSLHVLPERIGEYELKIKTTIYIFFKYF